MTPETFLNEFKHLTNAPGGVTHLREMVLRFAVTGHLTQQDMSESADEFLDEISAVRKRWSASKKYSRNKDSEAMDSPILPSLPPNWRWCRFGDLCSFSAGKTPPRKEPRFWNTGEYDWYSIADLRHGEEVGVSKETVSDVARHQVFKSEPISAGTLLMSFKLTIGKLSILKHPAYHNEAIIAIFPFADCLKNYFFKCLNGFDLTADNKAAIKGRTLNQKSLSRICVALPPRDEIGRIVAKVDELMALCDDLEAQQTESRRVQLNLCQSALQRLGDANNPTERARNWTSVHNAFPDLTTRPENIRELRKTILCLAVAGALSAQESTDWPLEDTCVGLSGHRPTADNLPHGWLKCRYEDLTTLITSGSRGWKKYYADSGAVFVRAQNIKTDALVLNDMAYVSLPQSVEGRRSLVKQWDILVTITGANVTKTALIDHQIPEAYVSQHIALTRPRWADMAPWLYLCLLSPAAGRGSLEGLAYGDKPGLNLNNIRQLILPLPPLAEQKRIVAKVDELMHLCDRLEQQLSKAESTAQTLAATATATFTTTDKNIKSAEEAPNADNPH